MNRITGSRESYFLYKSGFAGGNFQSPKLSKTKLIRSENQQEEKGENLVVNAGDTVFIPRKNEFGAREIALIVGQLSTVLLVLNAVGVFN